MGDVRDGRELNRSVAEYVRQTRDELERGRAEIERQKQALTDLGSTEDDEAAA